MPTKKKERDLITVTLAHPLRAEHAVQVGLEAKDYAVEDDVKVTRGYARTLINAGLVMDVDPSDTKAVNAALGIGKDAPAGSNASASGTPAAK
jgi:uncharacterized protein YabN with tetrapyrrole methylase and pyrophosphatase domain